MSEIPVDALLDGLRRVKASPETLVDQAGRTAKTYLFDAIECIDGQLGEGFTKKHPELIGHFMLTAALDFHAASVQVAGQRVEDGLTNLTETTSDRVSGIADALIEVSSSLDTMAEKLQNIATVLDDGGFRHRTR
jgi:hypothetical protein